MSTYAKAARGGHPGTASKYDSAVNFPQSRPSTQPVHELLTRLDGVRQTGQGRWIARCPAHQDRSPSLSIKEGTDSRVLVHCFSGCAVEDVLAAVGLTFSDLFPPRQPPIEGFRPRSGIHAARALDLIELAVREATICALVVGDVIDGRGTSIADCLRARQAVETIEGLRREVHHAVNR